jgi:ribosomal protein L9
MPMLAWTDSPPIFFRHPLGPSVRCFDGPMPVGVHSRVGQAMLSGVAHAYVRVILTDTLPRIGLQGEEVQLNSNFARRLLKQNAAVPVTMETLHAIPIKDGKKLVRTPELLQRLEHKRRTFFDPFWAITATMLRFERRRLGPSKELAVPVSRLDIANQLWLSSKIKVQPPQVVFALPKQQDIKDVGYHIAYVELEGGEGLEDICYSTRFARLRMKVVTQNIRGMY